MAGYLPALGEALRDYANHKKEVAAGRVKSLDETLAQRDMFDERAQIVEILMREMDTRGAKSAAALKALLDRYARLAQNVSDPNTASLFGEEVPDTRPMEILENARRELAEEEGTGGQRSLPGADAGNRVRQAARAKPDAPDAGQGRGPDTQGEVGGRFSTKEPPKRLYGAELERALDAANTTQDGVYDPLTAAQRDLVRKQHEDAWRERDAYLAALREVADATGLEYDPSMEPHAVKDIPGIAKKVRKDGELGATDALRYTLVLPPDSAPDAGKHGARTVRELRNRGYTVLRDKDGKTDVDNSFAAEKGKYGSGYRDFAIKVTKNGEVMELQLLQRNMLDKKFGEGHDLYEGAQGLREAIRQVGGINAQEDRKWLLATVRRMRKIYTAAFEADNPRLSSERMAQPTPNSAISSLESNADERNASSSVLNTAALSPRATASSKDSPDLRSPLSSIAGSTFMSRTSNPSVPQGDGGVNTKDSGPRYSTAAQAVEIYGTPERALRAHMNQLSVVRREGRIVDDGAIRMLADLSRQVGDVEFRKEARRFMFDTAREKRERAAEFKGMAGRETGDLFAGEQGGLFSTFQRREPPRPGQPGWGDGNMSLRAEEAVREGKRTADMIAKEYGVSRATVEHVLPRRGEWHHVLMEGKKTPDAVRFYDFDPKNDEVDRAWLMEMKGLEKGRNAAALQKRTRTVALKRLGLTHKDGEVRDADGKYVGSFRPWGFDASAGKNADAAQRVADTMGLSPHGKQEGSYLQREVGDFGPIFEEYKGDADGAVQRLMQEQDGEAVGALHHDEVGDIDLVWGETGPKNKGFGLAKIADRHPEVLKNLQAIVSSTTVMDRNSNSIFLESPSHESIIRLNWFGRKKTWLLTAYEKDNAPDAGRMIDVPSKPEGPADRQAPQPIGGDQTLPPSAPPVNPEGGEGRFSTRAPIKRGESLEYDRTAAEYDTASREAGRIRQLLWNFRERRYTVTERRSAEERKRRGIKPGQYAPDVNPELTKRLNAREEALRKRLKEAEDKADTAFTAWREAGEAAGVRFSVAPNGKPSNLNAHQWAQVRTQAFKRWGGDWEAWGHRQFLEGEPVARLTGEEFPNDGNPLLRRVIDFLSGKPTVRNSALGDVIVDARSIKDSWRHGRNTAKAAAFAAVPDIIGNGRVVFRKNNWKNRNYERVLLAAPITIGAEDYVAVVAVNSKPDSNRFFFHEVVLTKRIRESALTTGSYPEESGRPRADDESIPSVLHHIFSVKPPSVLTDDNGEPRTFYHLTYADFATFNTPAFFAESPEGLSDYGNRTIRAFLSIGNMATDADIVSAAREARVPSRENAYEYLSKGLIDSIGDRNVDRVASILKTRGFDGAKVSDYDVPQSYVVFSPTQIKSATGNTGAFDPDNPDIRFSTAPPPGSNIPQTTWTRYRLAAFTAAMVHGQDRAAYRQAMLDQHGPAVEPYLDEFANDYDTAYAAAVQRAQQAARMQAPPERPRPDLGRIGTSQEAQTDLDRVDATRENPERGQADWERQADEWLAATPEPEAIAAIRAKAENGESLTPGETKAAHRLYDILHERWVQSGDPKDRQAALEFAAAYRDTGSTVSDEMNARKIPTTPAGVAHWLMEHLTAPGRALERRIGAARAVTRDKSATGAQKATARRVLAKLLEKQGQQVDKADQKAA